MAAIRKRKWKTPTGEARSGWSVEFTNAQGKREKRLFTRKSEADAFRTEIEGQLSKGLYRPDAAKITVQEGAELFLAHCRERMERRERMTRRNLQTYEGYVRNYICPDPAWHALKHAKARNAFRPFGQGIASRTLAQTSVGVIVQLRDDLREFGLSIATTRKLVAMLRVMFSYLISRDLMAVNPAREVKVIGRREDESKKIIPPDPALVRELIGLADGPFAVKLLFAAASGVRAGELHALRWKHLDFFKREVSIESRVDPYGDEDVPKTAAGVRIIPLGDDVLLSLKEWRIRSRYSAADDLVFPNAGGAYANHDNMVKRYFQPLFGRLAKRWQEEGRKETIKRFNWHALRHFAISMWIAAGLKPKTVQTFAGHSSLQVTMDRYGHLFRSAEHGSAMDGVASAIAAAVPFRPAALQTRNAKGHFERKL